jgi:hypothetical protein
VTETPAHGRRLPSEGRWHVIDSALDGWGRTLRLCLILLVASVPPSVIYLGVSWMVHRG